MGAKKQVGYIGLGNIGRPCAERMIGDDFAVVVYDAFLEAMEPVVSAGATGAASVGELAAACEHIGICVRDDAQVEALLYGDDGILSRAAPGTLVAVHSTVTQKNIVRWHEEASEKGVQLIDAPITGGAHRAADGTLCYMVGGTAEQVALGSPVFMTSGEKVVHAGDIGAGIALKLCNNFMQYTEFVAMAEATRLATACGLSVDVLREEDSLDSIAHVLRRGHNDAVILGSRQCAVQVFFTQLTHHAKELRHLLFAATEGE